MAFATLLSAAGCDAGPVESPEGPPLEERHERIVTVPGAEFELRVGESARVEGTDLSVTFHAVQEDSRCPTDVTCVWEGNARIVIDAEQGSEPRRRSEINTILEPRSAAVPPYRIDLVELSPWPKDGVLTREDEYVARLTVTRR